MIGSHEQNTLKKDEKSTYINLFESTVMEMVKGLIEQLLRTELEDHQKIIAPRDKKYLNGVYLRSLVTKFGLVENIRVPRLRGIKFRSKLFSPWQRRMTGIDEIITKIFIQGESYRDIQRFFQMKYSDCIALSTITRITNKFLNDLKDYHSRPIRSNFRVLWIDGVYFGVKTEQQSVALLIMGLNAETNKKEIIDFMIAKQEDFFSYRKFLKNLVKRGLRIDQSTVVVHDGHPAIQKAMKDIFGEDVKQQNCIFHKLQNIQYALINNTRKQEVLSAAKYLYSAKDYQTYQLRKSEFIKTFRYKEPYVVKVVKRDQFIVTKYQLPLDFFRLVNTNNPLERKIKEIRRRTKVIGSFEHNKSLDKILFLTIDFINQLAGNVSFSPKLSFTQF